MPVALRRPFRIGRSFGFVFAPLFLATLATGSAFAGADAGTAAASCPELADGLAAYRRGDFAAAGDLLLRAVSCRPVEAGDHYDAGCALALGGRVDDAVAELRRAIELGYLRRDAFESDPDLAAVRSDPRFPALLAELDARAARENAIWSGKAFSTAFRDPLPPEERVAGLARVWAEARSNFANFDLVPGLDWDGEFLARVPAVLAATSTAVYYRELQRFVALLHDGHTDVQPPAELRPALFGRPPLFTRRVAGHVLVERVLDLELERRGVARGAELVAVDGEPVDAVARRVGAYRSASTPQDAEVRAYRDELLRGAAGSRVKLEFASDSGGTREVEVERWASERIGAALGDEAPLAISRLPGGLLRVELRTFDTPEVATAWFAHWDEIAAAKGLVLDLRANGGGSSGNGYRILGSLVGTSFSGSSWKTRLYRPTFRAWGYAEGWFEKPAGSWPADGEHRFAGPVALLIGPRTFSAAEDFAVAFDAARRGPLVGTATAGSTGQPLFLRLPGGGSLRICTKRDRYPDGREFIGRGVQPTVAVVETVADFRAGRDAALERAAEAVRAAIGTRDASVR